MGLVAKNGLSGKMGLPPPLLLPRVCVCQVFALCVCEASPPSIRPLQQVSSPTWRPPARLSRWPPGAFWGDGSSVVGLGAK